MYKEISTEYLREKGRSILIEIAALRKQKEDITFELENKHAIFNGLSAILDERESELVAGINIE